MKSNRTIRTAQPATGTSDGLAMIGREGEIAPPSPRSWKPAWLYTAAIALGMLVAAITAFSAGATCAFFDVALSPSVRLGAIWLSLTAGVLAGRGVFWLANEFEAKHRRAALRDDGPR